MIKLSNNTEKNQTRIVTSGEKENPDRWKWTKKPKKKPERNIFGNLIKLCFSDTCTLPSRTFKTTHLGVTSKQHDALNI